MHQIQFPLGLCLKPCWKRLQRSSKSHNWILRILLLRGEKKGKRKKKRRKKDKRRKKEKKRQEKERGGRKRKKLPIQISGYAIDHTVYRLRYNCTEGTVVWLKIKQQRCA